MSDYTIKVDELFRSTGYFHTEYKEFLFSLEMSEQKYFITELYKRVTSEQYKYQQGKDAFGTKIFDRTTEYRYSEDDLEEAKKLKETLSGETFLKSIGKDHECLEYRATYIFHQRKVSEIEFEVPEIERFFKSITNRVKVKNALDNYIDNTSVFKDIEFRFIKYPPLFTKEDFKAILSRLNLKECFYSNDHFKYFLLNTFEFYAEAEKPILINLPISSKNKALIRKKIHQLFTDIKKHTNYKEGIEIYPELKVKKLAYSNALFCCFSAFRLGQGNKQTYEGIVSNIDKNVRP